jgi:hypothetical protein
VGVAIFEALLTGRRRSRKRTHARVARVRATGDGGNEHAAVANPALALMEDAFLGADPEKPSGQLRAEHNFAANLKKLPLSDEVQAHLPNSSPPN